MKHIYSIMLKVVSAFTLFSRRRWMLILAQVSLRKCNRDNAWMKQLCLPIGPIRAFFPLNFSSDTAKGLRQCNIRLLRLNLSLWVKLNCEAKGRKSKKPFNNILLQRRQSDQLFGYLWGISMKYFVTKVAQKFEIFGNILGLFWKHHLNLMLLLLG